MVDFAEQLELENSYAEGERNHTIRRYCWPCCSTVMPRAYSRASKLEQVAYESIAFRYIAADNHLDHDTIATFRKRFLKDLEGRVQMPLVAKALGVLKMVM